MGQTYAKFKLFEAIDCDNLFTCKYIINKYPSLLNISLDNHNLCFPLMRAVHHNHVLIFQFLIN